MANRGQKMELLKSILNPFPGSGKKFQDKLKELGDPARKRQPLQKRPPMNPPRKFPTQPEQNIIPPAIRERLARARRLV